MQFAVVQGQFCYRAFDFQLHTAACKPNAAYGLQRLVPDIQNLLRRTLGEQRPEHMVRYGIAFNQPHTGQCPFAPQMIALGGGFQGNDGIIIFCTAAQDPFAVSKDMVRGVIVDRVHSNCFGIADLQCADSFIPENLLQYVLIGGPQFDFLFHTHNKTSRRIINLFQYTAKRRQMQVIYMKKRQQKILRFLWHGDVFRHTPCIGCAKIQATNAGRWYD